MGLLAIVYGIAMSLIAAHSNRAVSEAFRLRFENQDLLARLSAAQVSLAQTNQSLEQRVEERGAALERQTEALRDAQRMESVGLLAGGVAHDFNNLLTVVLGNVELLLHDTGPSERSRLEEIQSAANRGATLVSQLLAFSRRQVMVRRVLDLNAMVTEVRPLLSRLIGEHIELVVWLAPGPLPVQADPTQLQQTIINLATNARDAMTGGGTLTIETERADRAPAGTTLPEGRYVALAVRDTGAGMDEATRRLVFHPFFTTKEVGKGTGLGLATVHGIVEQSGGQVLVESEPGHGSCFRVFLPLVGVEKIEVAASAVRTPPAGSPASATILIAEDEALVRHVIARVLGRAGYTVIEAQDGEQALQMVRRHTVGDRPGDQRRGHGQVGRTGSLQATDERASGPSGLARIRLQPGGDDGRPEPHDQLSAEAVHSGRTAREGLDSPDAFQNTPQPVPCLSGSTPGPQTRRTIA